MIKCLGYDSSLMRALKSLSEGVISALLWLICSLPIITMGASTAALCRITIDKYFSEKKNSAAYYRAFRETFGISTILMLALLAAGAAFGGLLYAVRMISSEAVKILLTVFCVIFLYVIAAVCIYAFPLLAYCTRLQGKVRLGDLLQMALTIGVSNPFRPLPYMLVMLIPVILFLYFPLITLYLLPFWLLWPGVLIQWITGRLFKQFQQYSFQEEDE